MDRLTFGPDWFQRELRAINPRYFAVFNPRKQGGRWQVRAWKFYHKPSPTDRGEWERRSNIILTISRLKEEDGGLADAGYQPLDGRALFAVKKSRHDTDNVKQLLYEVDKANDEVEAKAHAEEWDMSEQVARDILNHYHHPRVGYGD